MMIDLSEKVDIKFNINARNRARRGRKLTVMKERRKVGDKMEREQGKRLRY